MRHPAKVSLSVDKVPPVYGQSKHLTLHLMRLVYLYGLVRPNGLYFCGFRSAMGELPDILILKGMPVTYSALPKCQ